MGDSETTVSPRINLAKGLDAIPKSASVGVTFDYQGFNVQLPANADVDVTLSRSKIQFDLNAVNVPQGTAVSIQGIEFTKPGEPSGSYAPANIFENPSTFTDQGGNSHTVYGQWKANKHFLKLVDDNPPEGEQDYGYRVWVKCDNGTTSSYHCSPDPTIKNKPTT